MKSNVLKLLWTFWLLFLCTGYVQANVSSSFTYDDRANAAISFDYDVQNQAAVAYDSTAESAVNYDAASVLLMCERPNEMARTCVLFAKFAKLLAADSGVWDLGPITRGNSMEQTLGANLPQNFSVIDQFANGTATSIKSIDLTVASDQNPGALASRLNGYVDSVAGFNGDGRAGVNIDASEITARQLQLAVQPAAASAAQQAVINPAAARAQGRGVNFIVTPVP